MFLWYLFCWCTFLSLFTITNKFEKGHKKIVQLSLGWKRQIECRSRFYLCWPFCFLIWSVTVLQSRIKFWSRNYVRLAVKKNVRLAVKITPTSFSVDCGSIFCSIYRISKRLKLPYTGSDFSPPKCQQLLFPLRYLSIRTSIFPVNSR